MKNGLIYSLLTAVLFVTLEPVSKLIAGDISPYAITFWRFLIGVLILLPPAIRKIRQNHLHITPRALLVAWFLGVLFICISMVSLQIGVKIADSPSIIAIIFSSNSIFTIVFSMLLLHEKLTKNKALALLFGTIGVLFCADFSSGTNLLSILLGLFAALSFSLYTVLTRKFAKAIGGIVQTALVFLFGSLTLFFVLLFTRQPLFPAMTPSTFAILAYLGLFVTGVGYAAYFLAIEKGGPIMGSLAFFIKPILTPFVTLFINGVVPDFRVLVAVLFIVAASVFAVYKKK